MFAGYVLLAYAIIVYFLANLQTPSQSLFRKHYFRDPILVTFYLYIYLINVVSSSGMSCGQCRVIVKFNKQQLSDFFNQESSHFESLLTPKICDPILVTLLKMRPHPVAHPHQPLVMEHHPLPLGNFYLQLDIDQNFQQRFQHPQLSIFFFSLSLQVTTIPTSLRVQTPCHYRAPSKSDHNFPSLSQCWNLSYPLNIIFNY